MRYTLVGYSGGTKESPTYHALGDHTEVVKVVYDPRQVSLEDLLHLFWQSHLPFQPTWNRQYESLLLYQTPQERQVMEEVKHLWEEREKRTLYTRLAPFQRFYRAEDYHQKYYLQNSPLFAEVRSRFASFEEFLQSPVVSRLNGYVAGYGEWERIEADLAGEGFSSNFVAQLRQCRRPAVCH